MLCSAFPATTRLYAPDQIRTPGQYWQQKRVIADSTLVSLRHGRARILRIQHDVPVDQLSQLTP
jgi:hypothetical protein